MPIEYRDTHAFTRDALERLFLSVNWSSGHYPDKLIVAMRYYPTVFSAWDGEMLVGMVCAMDDGAMNAYVHYLLVDPEHQGMGIGKALLERVKDKYRDYLRIAIIAYDDDLPFYERCGFVRSDHSSPMFITSLWT